VHLEILNPGEFLDVFIDAGSDIITIHPVSTKNAARDLKYLRAKKIKSSIAIDPEVGIEDLIKYLPLVDLIIVMSVYPGFGKQDFIPSSLDKIEQLKSTIIEKNLDIKIAVDGSINDKTSELVVKSGADILIYGSSIFKT
jgi:ribulose-phosphate 3-epimerase